MGSVTTTQALKKLYKKIMGVDTTKNSVTKILDEMAGSYIPPREPEMMYDYTCNSGEELTLSKANAEGSLSRKITLKSGQTITAADLAGMTAYMVNTTYTYPLIVTTIQPYNSDVYLTFKAIVGAPSLGSSASAISGALHIVAPFEIDSDAVTM